jgi:hypothetical protein
VRQRCRWRVPVVEPDADGAGADADRAVTGARVLAAVDGRCDGGASLLADVGVVVLADGIGAPRESVRPGRVQPVSDVAVAASATTTMQIRPRISVHPIFSASWASCWPGAVLALRAACTGCATAASLACNVAVTVGVRACDRATNGNVPRLLQPLRPERMIKSG